MHDHDHSADHKGAMVDVYSKMKLDSFKLQLQTVLTTFYEDINGFNRSGRQWLPQDQHKVVKCKFKDQEETRATPDEDMFQTWFRHGTWFRHVHTCLYQVVRIPDETCRCS